MKKQLSILTTLLFILLLAGCKKETSNVSLVPGAKGSPALLTEIPLTVTINHSYTENGAELSSRITSDLGIPYVNGVDLVKAVIDKAGQFYFLTNNSKNQLAKRHVIYDLTSPVDPDNWYLLNFANGNYTKYNYIFTTSVSTSDESFVPLQNLAVGSSQCLGITGNINGDKVNSIFKYTVRFRAGKEDVAGNPTANVVVTRVSDDVWTIRPVDCTGEPNTIGGLWTGDTRNEISKGYFYVPFSFTLTRK